MCTSSNVKQRMREELISLKTKPFFEHTHYFWGINNEDQ